MYHFVKDCKQNTQVIPSYLQMLVSTLTSLHFVYQYKRPCYSNFEYSIFEIQTVSIKSPPQLFQRIKDARVRYVTNLTGAVGKLASLPYC